MTPSPMPLGFVGTGTMGNPMVRCLLEAGHHVTIYDRRPKATTDLQQLGAHRAENPRAVAENSDVVFTSLPGPPEVEQVVCDPQQGILSGLRPGTAYIDMTTNSPTVFRRIADQCREKGVDVLDAPVSSRPPDMTIMVGGHPDTFATYQPLLACMGRHVFYVGETGAGCTAKLVSQYLGYANFIAAAEGLLIGAKAGIDLEVLGQLIPVSAGASRAFHHFPRTVFSGELDSAGSLDIVAKDLGLACELARDVQVPARIGAIVVDVLQQAQERGWGAHGFPIAVQVMEQMAGVKLRTPRNP